ncbi:energy-coupling factor transporter transmembrane protein EcfT [Clostridium tagluense]|uniref:energy-coupling factor transporter transmembrane component T n=1 Tax=Clostridium tagluense TaxID=360422 RepID=UPI001CF583BA|nr:energy-coupling factor transporter transmembrane component T [Clostridium tagluense]MCB2310894.1 energy-coupling factor transporter transmembrane protein EcfT [Clostridium tagluense]MCB2315748.1 energy-coupling factor transporter transmembrane protein EcfT [Clostridium tagluense]MCB2320608.1 energy-coupling factor transporter transmembrane protein EcfT [Clostridium tagluense]MCB2325487.1 energy-coupling factor transporter transmembrane protein EcfT [Clostridium tagluense]MCB2330340.1 energy
MTDSFSTFHPVINFSYFTSVLLFSMFFIHPIFLGIALICSFTYSIMLKGKSALKFNLIYMLPLLVFMAIINPAFNHEGVTIIFYLKNGNPITLESILYGVMSAGMFISVILWFSCYNVVMTSDKFIYIFGKIIPALSLIFSMVLRFVPRYKQQIKIISNGQKCIGRDISQGNIIKRAKNGIKILSIMTTWALENAIETADSMKSRGYGLTKRSSFSIFHFDDRDKITLTVLSSLIIYIFIGMVMGQNTMRFFPSMKIKNITFFSITIYISYFILCILPVIINIAEVIKWKHIRSRI